MLTWRAKLVWTLEGRGEEALRSIITATVRDIEPTARGSVHSISVRHVLRAGNSVETIYSDASRVRRYSMSLGGILPIVAAATLVSSPTYTNGTRHEHTQPILSPPHRPRGRGAEY